MNKGMREDKDFKPTTLEDGTTVYTNLDEVCKGLPEFGSLWCSICHEEIDEITMKSKTGFFRMKVGNTWWYKVFHDDCYMPKDNKKAES